MPQNDAGCRIEPPVSEPSATGTAPAATSAAEPPLDPPGVRPWAPGVWTAPNADVSVDEPIPNPPQSVADSFPATEAGIFSGASYAIGMENVVPANPDQHHDTAADMSFRAAVDPSFDAGSGTYGPGSGTPLRSPTSWASSGPAPRSPRSGSSRPRR